MSWQILKRLREERAAGLAEMKKIVATAEGEKRELSADERTEFDRLNTEAETRAADITRIEKAANLEAELAKRNGNRPGREATDDPETRDGFSEKDLAGYSLLRAISLRANNMPLDGLEREISDELALRSGKKPQGFYFPTQVALSTRALDTTNGAGGINKTVATTFIELLRDRTLLNTLGASMIGGLVGDFTIPKQTGGATAYWLAEGNAPTGSNATLGQVGFSPRTVGAYTDISRKFVNQTALDAEAFVRNDLATVLAIAIDKAGLAGSGAGNEPTGILNDGAVPAVAIGANGGAATFAKMVELETAVATANADMGRLAYVTNAKVRGALKTKDKGTDTGKFVWNDDNTVNGYAAHATNLIPSNLTKGSGTNLSAAIFGNWADLVIAMWGGLDILVDPYTGSSSGTVRITALQDVDVKLRQSASFAKIADIVA